jgi:hypothetical protein
MNAPLEGAGAGAWTSRCIIPRKCTFRFFLKVNPPLPITWMEVGEIANFRMTRMPSKEH